MKLVADARIKEGRLTFNRKSTVLSDIGRMRDGDYVVTIEKKHRKRSLNQNAYYWGVIIDLVHDGLIDAGYRITHEETHEFLKGKFAITEYINERNGEILKSIGSTANMTTSQMMDYFSEITQWAAEYLNVQIPEPNEQLTIEINQ